MSWELSIEKADNGFIVCGRSDATDKKVVLSEHETDIYDNINCDNNLTVAKDLLQEILEYFAIYYSDHNDQYIDIKIRKNKK